MSGDESIRAAVGERLDLGERLDRIEAALDARDESREVAAERDELGGATDEQAGEGA